MKKDLLYRFFEGKTNSEEEKQIRMWMESSDANNASFMKERKLYDTLLLTSPKTTNSKNKQRSLIKYWIPAAVASFLLLLLSSLYLNLLLHEDTYSDYNTLIVPPGQRIHLILSDNTDIWLNANSTFRYPSEFSKKERTVYLDGEAFFDISKDPKKPFTVKTVPGDVKVTGTKFNLEAYTKQGSFETSLFEGSVDVYLDNLKITTLSPNEKSHLEGGKLHVSPITNNDKYLWRDGLIAFNNQSLEEILLSLEKYFAVNIQVQSKTIHQHTYTGKFRQADGVDYALRVLQKSIRFSYHIEEETGNIYIR